MAILPYSPLQHYPAPRQTGMPALGAHELSSGVHTRDPIPDLKREMARIVVDRLDGWSQANAAHLLDTDQPRMSDLRRGNVRRFSLEQLLRFAARLGARVDFTVTWDPRRRWIASRFSWPNPQR